MRGWIRGMVAPAAAMTALLAGCGGDSSEVKTTYYRFKAIDYLEPAGDSFTQKGRWGFGYGAGGKLERLTHYHQAGTDGKWGTDDDQSDYFVSCDFVSDRGPGKSIDIGGELSEGLRALYLTAPAALASLPLQDVAGACESGYSGQSGLTQKVFASGADGKPATADDTQLIRLDWSSITANQSRLNVAAPGFAGESRDFYYRKSLDGLYLYVVTDGMYRRYAFKADYAGLTAIDRKSTVVAPAAWVMELDSDTRLDSVVYTAVSATSSYRCSRNAADQPVKKVLVIINGNLPSAQFHLGAGTDGIACTPDDDGVILSKELYVLEEAG